MEKKFASLKLLDSDTDDWKITETINYSQTPSSQRICVNQTCQREIQPNLVRQHSCEQIFNEHAIARQMTLESVQIDNKISNECQTTTESYFDSFTSLNRQFCKSSNILQAPKFVPNKPFSEILPDKIENVNPTNESELHCSAANANAINEVDYLSSVQFKNPKKTVITAKASGDTKVVNQKTYQEIKSKFRPLVLKNKISPKKKRNMCCYSCLILCLLPIATVILAMFLNLNIPTVCNRAMFFSNATQELQQKIHGQENAISNIIHHINQDISYLKVLSLIGGTGVGKSYTVDIIAKHFPLKEDIFIYDTLFPYSTNGNLLNLFDSYQLVIMENLKIKNLDIFSNIIDVLNKKKSKCITVIAIFNIQEVNNNLERTINFVQSINSINEALADKKVDSLIVPYQPLNEETLQTCIIEAATISNLTLTSNQINEIKQNLLLSASGCKGAYAKVQVIGR
ncbi:hypothetical protein WN51_07856 [Melipona quadrifasciata]|uniref:Uncharacterized protein n=1 Tax=Melipona quadrifasciata TaxID=166423 RepID=A0A0M9A973_9HYME|nr:hypothetical protein WN51_07856 [Melipona quadrifasciata]